MEGNKEGEKNVKKKKICAYNSGRALKVDESSATPVISLSLKRRETKKKLYTMTIIILDEAKVSIVYFMYANKTIRWANTHIREDEQ
jgi:mannitol/fructose-specific phosphotransferase system IIA component